MPKKEPLKMSKKRIFKDFLKEAKQHRPIVFYTDNDCDGMLAGSVLMSVCYRLGIKDFFFFSPLRNAHGYGFTDLAINDLLSKPCIFNPKTNQLVRLDYIKNQFQKDPFSADLGADLAADTQLQEILLERFEQCIITDHHKSFEVGLIDENKIAYINLNDEKDANYYSGAFTSALVATNFLKKYSFNRSLCIYRDNKDGYGGSARGNFLSQIKTIPLIQARGHEEAFGLSFVKKDFKKVVKSLQAL